MIRTFFFILIFFNLIFDVFANELIIGFPKIIDGDTIKINGISIRLHGIDTPERHQKCKDIDDNFYNCGEVATNQLRLIINEQQVKCEKKDKDRYKRIIGVCFSNEENLNALLVKKGMGIAYRYYSVDYVEEEEFAKKNKLGIWSGRFIEPYEWRKGKRF